MRRRRIGNENPDEKLNEYYRAVVDNITSISMYNEKNRSICIIRKNLAKDYEVEVDASEAPIMNKLLKDPEPYEVSMADLKILEEQIFPINQAFKEVFGQDKELKLNSIKLAVGSSLNDFVTIRENDLKKFDVRPTLTGLRDFIDENNESILGFLDCEYINEEGNVIYLSCGAKDLSNNIYSLKVKVLSSMQQRGFFLQQEHKYYGLQLFIVLESKKPDEDKLLSFLKELNIDWELIFFRRKLAIHDWTEIECQLNSENLKQYLRVKYENLNYFDINNIIRIISKNELSFSVADKMASLLYKMKSERAYQMQEHRTQYSTADRTNSHDRTYITGSGSDRTNQSIDEYSLTLKKAEIAASAKIACAYLGIQKEIVFDRDISTEEILKYQEELTNF